MGSFIKIRKRDKTFKNKMKLLYSAILALAFTSVYASDPPSKKPKKSKYAKKLIKRGRVKFQLDSVDYDDEAAVAASSVDDCYASIGIMDRRVQYSCKLIKNLCMCKVEKEKAPTSDPLLLTSAQIMVNEGMVTFHVNSENASDCHAEIGPIDEKIRYTCDIAVAMAKCIDGLCPPPSGSCFCALSSDVKLESTNGDIMIREGSVSFQILGDNLDDCYIGLGPMDRGVFHTCHLAVAMPKCFEGVCPPPMGSCLCDLNDLTKQTNAEIMVENGSVDFSVEGSDETDCYVGLGMIDRSVLHKCFIAVPECVSESCGPAFGRCSCHLMKPLKTNAEIMIEEGSVDFDVEGQNEIDCYANLGPIDRKVQHKCIIAVPDFMCFAEPCSQPNGSCSCFLTDKYRY